VIDEPNNLENEEEEDSVLSGCIQIVVLSIFLIIMLGVISDGRITKPITDKLAETVVNNPELFWGDLAKDKNSEHPGTNYDYGVEDYSNSEIEAAIMIARSVPFHNFDKCVEDLYKKFQKSPITKEKKLIIFNSSQDDRDIKNLIESEIIPNSSQDTSSLNLNHLDKAFEWDRDNGMVHIYKILDLMDRNYSDDNWDAQYNSARLTCARDAYESTK